MQFLGAVPSNRTLQFEGGAELGVVTAMANGDGRHFNLDGVPAVTAGVAGSAPDDVVVQVGAGGDRTDVADSVVLVALRALHGCGG
ncbi:hypothetical protein EBT31_06565 [bacterium]|nr:hypothetical protein [bacterium]